LTQKTRILTGLLICVLVICVGLGTGLYLQHKKSQTQSGTAPVANMAIAPGKSAPKNVAPNSGIYDVSPPSIGVTLSMYDIDVKPVGNVSFMPLPKKETERVKEGQKILFYDASAVQIETLGEVTKVSPGTDQMEDYNMVHILLNGDSAVPASSIAKGRIIVGRDANTQRLPLTALVKNDKGEPFVWEITDNGNGTASVALVPANVVTTTYEYFVIAQDHPSTNIYILNPDEKLQDGQTIKINSILYLAPSNTDEERIAALMQRRAHDRTIKLTAEKDLLNGVTPSSAPAPADQASPGCPTSEPSGASAFIDQIEKMTPKQGEQSLPTSP